MSKRTIISLKSTMKTEKFCYELGTVASFLVNVNQSPVTNDVVKNVTYFWKWCKN